MLYVMYNEYSMASGGSLNSDPESVAYCSIKFSNRTCMI